MLSIDELKISVPEYSYREKRSGVYKVILPVFYEDGDMYDIYVMTSPSNQGHIRICDFGLTLMHQSYFFDLDTTHKRDVVLSIIAQNDCFYEEGNIYLDCKLDQFYFMIYHFIQVITKVYSVSILSRDLIKSLFFEQFSNFIDNTLNIPGAIKNYRPNNDIDLCVDYMLPSSDPKVRPIFVFGVNVNNEKAMKTIITCMALREKRILHHSLVVYEDFYAVSQYSQRQLTNASDKQFITLEDFEKGGKAYIERELAA